VENIALVITCPHCGTDQSVEIDGLPSLEEAGSMPQQMDRSAICSHCEVPITLHVLLRRRAMVGGAFLGQVAGLPIFPGAWFGTS
jgi:hypothetical protein